MVRGQPHPPRHMCVGLPAAASTEGKQQPPPLHPLPLHCLSQRGEWQSGEMSMPLKGQCPPECTLHREAASLPPFPQTILDTA